MNIEYEKMLRGEAYNAIDESLLKELKLVKTFAGNTIRYVHHS